MPSPEAAFSQRIDTITQSSDAREYNAVRLTDPLRVVCHVNGDTFIGVLKRLGYGVEVAHSVVYDCNCAHGADLSRIHVWLLNSARRERYAYNLPFVDGKDPWARGSSSTA